MRILTSQLKHLSCVLDKEYFGLTDWKASYKNWKQSSSWMGKLSVGPSYGRTEGQPKKRPIKLNPSKLGTTQSAFFQPNTPAPWISITEKKNIQSSINWSDQYHVLTAYLEFNYFIKGWRLFWKKKFFAEQQEMFKKLQKTLGKPLQVNAFDPRQLFLL